MQPHPPVNLVRRSGGGEAWWARRSGDGKRVGEKVQVGLFALGQDTAEQNDLAKCFPEEIATSTRLHDAWLANMRKPTKAGGKRYGMAAPDGGLPKKGNADRKKKKAAATPDDTL